jgi:hypothetical protein
MGEIGSQGTKVELAPGYGITYGEMTGLAGDHFESIEQMRAFAAKSSGKESREEIEYALEWKYKSPGRHWSPEAKAAQQARYYALAADNIAHFVNPETGDSARSTASKAGDVDTKAANRWWPKGQPKNAIAAYRLHHVQAINEALAAGKAGVPIDVAMAADAFGSHYLTDAFSGGHIRTERSSIVEYWNGRVPMFYYNFIGFLAEKVAEQLNDATGYSIMSKDMLVTGPPGFDGALDTVKKKVGKKGKLQFGDVVALALHDHDNREGVHAISEGRKVKLMGDGHAGEADEKFLAIRAVGMSVKDVEQAYALGQGGAANADSLLGSDGLFAAERVIPTADPDPTANAANPDVNWRTATVRDLLNDGHFQAALFDFCQEKRGEVQSIADDMGGAKKKALEDGIIARMHTKGSCVDLVWSIINWTPNTGGGAFGQNTDDNARAYYDAAKDTPYGVSSLTVTARINLIKPLLSGVWVTDGEEERVWWLLDTASDSDARLIIKRVGWGRLDDELEGERRRKFRARFPKASYAR